MIAIVDYGVGNLYSLTCSLRHIGAQALVTRDEAELRAAEKIILPGVGAFGDAADIPAWAQAEMQWANAEKLILGRDGKLLAPNAAATRAEMASILSGYAAA